MVLVLHQKCTFYPEFYVKKDRFDKVHKKLKADKSISLDTVRINILKHLDEKRQSVNEALFDNLKVFIYLAKDDKDLGILLRCFQTYSRVKQFQEMTISVLFIRKLVALNKLDYATDVLLNRVKMIKKFRILVECYIMLLLNRTIASIL